MKTGVGAMTTSQGAVATAEHVEPPPATHGADDTEHAEEAFEATILRLDGAAIEWLFRQVGE